MIDEFHSSFVTPPATNSSPLGSVSIVGYQRPSCMVAEYPAGSFRLSALYVVHVPEGPSLGLKTRVFLLPYSSANPSAPGMPVPPAGSSVAQYVPPVSSTVPSESSLWSEQNRSSWFPAGTVTGVNAGVSGALARRSRISLFALPRHAPALRATENWPQPSMFCRPFQ